MSEFDGFASVNDPREYLNAPAMLMMDNNGDSVPNSRATSPQKLPMILKAAIEYAADFDILSADELQQYYAEQSTLERRLVDVVNRLDVELKMREAAQSISKLHSNPDSASTANRRVSIASNRSSVIMNLTQSSPKPNRLSRLLGQDSTTKNEKRLSKQAADEAAISSEKIRDLENLRSEIERRKFSVDRTIMQHHAAVMSRALSSKPLSNHHQRSQSGASAMSSFSQNSARQSWIVAPRHQRQWSSNSNGDSSFMPPRSDYKSAQQQQMQGRGLPLTPSLTTSGSQSVLDDELNSLVSKISQAMPQTSPSPQGKVSFIANAFDEMSRDLSETRNALEASRVQIANSEQRIQYLNQQQRQQELQMEQQQMQLQQRGTEHEESAREISSLTANRGLSNNSDNLTLKELNHELELEHSAASHWRSRADEQRKQLETMAKNLEDVTRLAVQLESEHSGFEKFISKLQKKVGELEADKVDLLQQKLKSTSNTSLLCREFQEIVSELVARHDRELRSLYPKFSKRTPSSSLISDVPSETNRTSKSYQQSYQHGGGRSQNANEPELENRRRQSKSVKSRDDYPTQEGLEPAREQKEPYGSPHSLATNSDIRSIDSFAQHEESVAAANEERRSIPESLELPSDSVRPGLRLPPSSAAPRIRNNSSESHIALPKPIDTSFDDSIQHTDDSFIQRPSFNRQESETSEYSKTSSIYPEPPSANQSQLSIASRSIHAGPPPRQSQTSLHRQQSQHYQLQQPQQQRNHQDQSNGYNYDPAEDEIL